MSNVPSLQSSVNPIFPKNDDLIEPAKLRESGLPNDCLSLVLAYVGDPEVYEKFQKNIVEKAYRFIWSSYSEHPLISKDCILWATQYGDREKRVIFVYNCVMPSSFEKNVRCEILAQMEKGLAPLAIGPVLEIAQAAEDANLIKIFPKIIEKIAGQHSEGAEFLKKIKDFDPSKKAKAIRNWMNKHSKLLKEITALDLSKLGLLAVPTEIIAILTNLRQLNLSHNQLTSIPDGIDNLVHLVYVSFSHNQLTELPDEIGRLTNLTTLAVTDNQLTQIPDAIGDIDNLTNLFLSKNQLTTLPEALKDLPLDNLYLWGNPLTNQVKPILDELRDDGCEVFGCKADGIDGESEKSNRLRI
jgi:hypothetical protein